MNWNLYIILSTMMFLQFAVWGAWSPVLAARLLGPLKFNGKQTGWIYATMAISSIISPLIAAQMADKWVNTELILAIFHLAGAALLLLASRMDKFKALFITMGAYTLFYAATIPLTFSLFFTHLGAVAVNSDTALDAGKILVWIPVGWVLAGLLLTGWRHLKGDGDGSDCLKLAAVVSLMLGVFCFFLPSTPPPSEGGSAVPFIEALELLKQRNFLVFLILSFLMLSQLQFYFIGTAQFLGDIGVKTKHIPAVMATAQAAQIFATFVLLGWLLDQGFKVTLIAGAAAWMLMYLFYAVGRPKLLVILSMSLHGIAYTLFVFGGQIFTDGIAGENKSSAQALLTVVTLGAGLFVGSQFAGFVMDKHSKDGKFDWQKIFIVPCILSAICIALFVILFTP